MTTAYAELTTHDNADMLAAVAQLPDQLLDGLRRSRTVHEELARGWPADASGGPEPRSLVVCGMGGSGVGADLLPAAADTRCPVVAVKGYTLPRWVGDQDRVVCVSYSGETAETLACFDEAVRRSIVEAVITTGGTLAERARGLGIPVVELPAGLQPRAAVGLLFGALAGVASALHVIGDADDLVDQAVAGARQVYDADPDLDGGEPVGLRHARALHDCVVVVYGAEETVAVAHRWKAQVNENGKVPCFAAAYPELDHNEIVGWEHARATGARWALVELLPHAPSAAISARFDITRRLVDDAFDANLRLEPRSSTRAGVVFEQLAWGDVISVWIALLRGVDPTPVERIQALKAALGGR